MPTKGLIDDNPLLHGFNRTIRTLRAKVTNLSIVHSWQAPSQFAPKGSLSTPEMRVWIRGVANLDADSIAVVGSDKQSTRELSFEVSAFDRAWLSAHWKEHRTVLGDPLQHIESDDAEGNGRRLAQFIRNVFDVFDEHLPTAWVDLCPADWESGQDEEWILWCMISKDALDSLVSEVKSGRCQEAAVSVELMPTLVNKSLVDIAFEPCSEPVTFGVLEGRGRGWIKKLTWEVSDMSDGDDKQTRTQLLTDSADKDAAVGDGSIRSVISEDVVRNIAMEIRSLVSVTRIGFVLVLLVVLVVSILR